MTDDGSYCMADDVDARVTRKSYHMGDDAGIRVTKKVLSYDG